MSYFLVSLWRISLIKAALPAMTANTKGHQGSRLEKTEGVFSLKNLKTKVYYTSNIKSILMYGSECGWEAKTDMKKI